MHMLEVLKEQLLETQADWISKIDASKDGSVEIDISREVVKIFKKFISVAIFGEDINLETMPVIEKADDGSKTVS